MTPSHIDHLVITAPDLATGQQWLEQRLGATMQAGGEHPLMGTHNLLLSLGPDCYLEVIASSPTLPSPLRPRWFDLDHLPENALPSLTTWVARTENIEKIAGGASEQLGPVEAMFRGHLNWQITIPEDGSLPLDGTAPALIQWPKEQHPASKLNDQGLRLEQLELCHPQPAQLGSLLKSLNLIGPVKITQSQTSKLIAHIRTSSGLCSL